jgi:ABC-type sugar transport system ATPase subunit
LQRSHPTTIQISSHGAAFAAAGSPRASALRARGLTKTFEAGIPGCSATARALAGATLDLMPGEHVALVGAAGAGKSTLLLILAGILQPDRGNVLWLSQKGEPVKDGRSVEYIPAWRAGHALQSLRRAAAAAPGVLLVDDIFPGLDGASRREARALIRRLHAAQVTMLLASRHDPACMSMCTRVAALRSGRMEATVQR